MGVILLLGRLLLAGILVLAGVAKLADLAGSRKAISDFGLPIWVTPSLAVLLLLGEFMVAVLLAIRATAWWGSLGALTLFLAFMVVIGFNLARGKRPECRCFGQLHSAPVGWATLCRNALFAACAGFIVWQGMDDPGLGLYHLASDLIVVQGVGFFIGATFAVALAAEGWFIFHLLRQHGRVLLQIDNLELRLNAAGMPPVPVRGQPFAGLPIGSPAVPFALPVLSGGIFSLDGLRESGHPVLLLFSDLECGPCNALLPHVARWEREFADRLTIALVSRGTAEDHRAIAQYALRNVLIQRDREVAEWYHALVTPSAVLVDSDGSIGAPLAVGAQAITDLVSQVTGERVPVPLSPAAGNGRRKTSDGAPPAAPGLSVGQVTPPFRLSDLGGQAVELAHFKGRKVLMLFWNPRCRFCEELLHDVKVWEREQLRGAPELVVVSTGTDEANRAMGIRSAVLLDPNLSVHRAFGARGTPSAVLIDAEGRIASAMAVGAPAVLALAVAELKGLQPIDYKRVGNTHDRESK